MTISRVGAGTGTSSTITIPAGHQAGDLLVIFATRPVQALIPVVPAGWDSILAVSLGSAANIAIGSKIAASSAEVSGTWTNALEMGCGVYRGAQAATLFGNPKSGGTATIDWTDGEVSDFGDSWLVGFVGSGSVGSPSAPSDLPAQSTITSAVLCDSGAPYPQARRAANTSSITATAWISAIVEVRLAPPNLFENFKRIRAGDRMAVSL